MTTIIVGLGSAIFGALAALLGAFLAGRRQVRNEQARWRRDQLTNSYEQTLRHLLRAANRRAEFVTDTGEVSPAFAGASKREWFDDLVEAQIWLRTISRYCAKELVNIISRTADMLDLHVSQLASKGPASRGSSIWETLKTCTTIVTTCFDHDTDERYLTVFANLERSGSSTNGDEDSPQPDTEADTK